jgi:sporulation protein YlmC with PRC-barrel domain
MALHHFEIVREILDKQLVDKEETEMGRVDGVVLEIRDHEPPRVDHFELGFAVLADRIHPRLEFWLNAIRKRWSVRRSGRYSIPWSAVHEVRQHHITIEIDAHPTPAFDWERWLRRNIVKRLPGGEEE